MNISPGLMSHRARGCPFKTNVDGGDFFIDGFMKYDGYGDECKELYFAGVACSFSRRGKQRKWELSFSVLF